MTSESTDDVFVCRVCKKAWADTEVGARCPAGDGGALVPVAVHHANPNDTMLGRVVGGKYPIIGIVGKGGFGAVYKALQEPVGRVVALKVIADDAHDLRARFFREARVVAMLNSPATVVLHDYGEDDDLLFMVFEYLEGQELSDLLKAEAPLTPERAIEFALHILQALAEAHGHGMVHRDLKPGNIMVCPSPLGGEKIKVLDFGIAKLSGPEGYDGVETREGIVLGTPRYMSPEQSSDAELDGRSDLYALGVLLFEMLVGHVPFDGTAAIEILMGHISAPVPELPATVPSPLAAVVRRALGKRPDDRFESAESMAQALTEAMGGGRRSLVPGVLPKAVPEAAPVAARAKVAAAPAAEPVRVEETATRAGRWPMVIGGLLALAVGGGVWWFLTATTEPIKTSTNLEPVKVTISMGGQAQPMELAAIERLVASGDLEGAEAALVAALVAAPDRAGLARKIRSQAQFSTLRSRPKIIALLKGEVRR